MILFSSFFSHICTQSEHGSRGGKIQLYFSDVDAETEVIITKLN